MLQPRPITRTDTVPHQKSTSNSEKTTAGDATSNLIQQLYSEIPLNLNAFNSDNELIKISSRITESQKQTSTSIIKVGWDDDNDLFDFHVWRRQMGEFILSQLHKNGDLDRNNIDFYQAALTIKKQLDDGKQLCQELQTLEIVLSGDANVINWMDKIIEERKHIDELGNRAAAVWAARKNSQNN